MSELAAGWLVRTADLRAKVPTRDLLDEIGRRCPDA